MAVCFIQRIRDLDSVGEKLIERNGTSCKPIRQRLAFEIFHADEIDSIVVAYVVNNTDVGMI